jgi:hypothetical protein
VSGTLLGPATNFSPSLFDYFQTIAGLFMWGALSGEKKGSVICSAMTQVQFQVILRPTVCRPVRLGAGTTDGAHDHILISLFDNDFLSSRCRAPSPISPMNRVIQPEVKVKGSHQSLYKPSCYYYPRINLEFFVLSSGVSKLTLDAISHA